MHLPRHRAGRDGHRRHRHLGGHGNRRRERHLGHRRHRRRHRGSYRRHLHRGDHRDDRRHRRVHEHLGLGGVHRDDRPRRDVRRGDAGACCREWRRDAVHRRDGAEHPAGAGLHPAADAGRAARRVPVSRRGCCRRGARDLRALAPVPVGGREWGLRDPRVRPGWWESPRPAVRLAVQRLPLARRRAAPAELVAPARRADAARRAWGRRAWVPRWPRHRWWMRRQRPPWGLPLLSLRARASSRRPVPRGAGGRRAPQRSTMLI
jgi:hypothetical protein